MAERQCNKPQQVVEAPGVSSIIYQMSGTHRSQVDFYWGGYSRGRFSGYDVGDGWEGDGRACMPTSLTDQNPFVFEVPLWEANMIILADSSAMSMKLLGFYNREARCYDLGELSANEQSLLASWAQARQKEFEQEFRPKLPI